MVAQSTAKSVAGMVTLYNSEQVVIQRLSTYVDQVGKVYAVDNSEYMNPELIEALQNTYPNVEYIRNEGNLGIASALNVAAQAAIRDQYAYLLMMDDDSEAPTDLVDTLHAVAVRNLSCKVGIVSAQSDAGVQRIDEQQVDTTITSGSLLNLRAYQEAGPFMEALFIDWVDHEYCFRLAQNGYRILIINRIRLVHQLGIIKKKRLLGFIPVRWRSHNPVRLYYKFRNSLYVMSTYSTQLRFSFMLSVCYELLRDIVKVIFAENDKGVYLKAIRLGISDAYRKRLGNLSAR